MLHFIRWRSNSTKINSKIVTDLNLSIHSAEFNYNHQYRLVSVITHKGHDAEYGKLFFSGVVFTRDYVGVFSSTRHQVVWCFDDAFSMFAPFSILPMR